jgi:hypothetical protein
LQLMCHWSSKSAISLAKPLCWAAYIKVFRLVWWIFLNNWPLTASEAALLHQKSQNSFNCVIAVQCPFQPELPSIEFSIGESIRHSFLEEIRTQHNTT